MVTFCFYTFLNWYLTKNLMRRPIVFKILKTNKKLLQGIYTTWMHVHFSVASSDNLKNK